MVHLHGGGLYHCAFYTTGTLRALNTAAGVEDIIGGRLGGAKYA